MKHKTIKLKFSCDITVDGDVTSKDVEDWVHGDLIDWIRWTYDIDDILIEVTDPED